jgi:single-strand DNA-binding protein
MANLNKVMLIGNLTRDPMLKALPSGTQVVEFGLAINRTWKDARSGEQREATTFVDCKTMGRPAEIIHQYMQKGSPLFVEGRLDFRSWDAKDGTKRSKLEVFVENFQFLGRREEGGGGRPPARPAASAGASGGYGGGGYDGGRGAGGSAGDFGDPLADTNFDDDTPF